MISDHDEADLRAQKFDAAVLAVVPIVLGLTEKGRAALDSEGTSFLSDAEHAKIIEIVTAVENALK